MSEQSLKPGRWLWGRRCRRAHLGRRKRRVALPPLLSRLRIGGDPIAVFEQQAKAGHGWRKAALSGPQVPGKYHRGRLTVPAEGLGQAKGSLQTAALSGPTEPRQSLDVPHPQGRFLGHQAQLKAGFRMTQGGSLGQAGVGQGRSRCLDTELEPRLFRISA